MTCRDLPSFRSCSSRSKKTIFNKKYPINLKQQYRSCRAVRAPKSTQKITNVTKILYEKEGDFIPGVRSALHRLTGPFAPDQRDTLVPVDTLTVLHDSSNSNLFLLLGHFYGKLCNVFSLRSSCTRRSIRTRSPPCGRTALLV